MAEAYSLTIDLPRLTRNFNATDSRGWTEPEVVEWLKECGFQLQDDGSWVAEEISLDVLDRSEYRVVKRL